MRRAHFFKYVFFFLPVFLYGLLFSWTELYAINRLLEGHRASYGTPKYIDGSVIGGVCKKVTIPVGSDIFIGTKSIYEWNSFVWAAPSLGITLDSCLDCTNWSALLKSAWGTGDDFPNDIATDGSGNIFITGNFFWTGDLFGQSLYASGTIYSDIYLSKLSSDGKLIWSLKSGGTNTDQGLAVAVDNSGSVYIWGEYLSSSAHIFGNNFSQSWAWDVFLSKLDASGTTIWNKAFWTTTLDYLKDVAVDPTGNIYAIGSFKGSGVKLFGQTLTSSGVDYNLYIAKFTDTGATTWVKRWWNTGLYGHRIVTDSLGNIIVSWLFNGTVVDVFGQTLVDSGASDGFVAKLDNAANPLWVRKIGNSANATTPPEITIDYEDNIIIGGDMQVWSSPMDIFWQTVTASGLNNIYVAKVNTWGSLVWLKYTTIPNTKRIEIWGIDTDEVGNIALNGFLDGSGNVFGQWLISTGIYEWFQAKLSHTGWLMWARKTDSWWNGLNTRTAKLTIDPENNIVTTSSFSGTLYDSWVYISSAGWVDTLLTKFTPGGIQYESLFYMRRAGWTWVDWWKAISLDLSWNRYIWWYFSGTTANIFGTTFVWSWGADMFVTKIDQFDNISWSKKGGWSWTENITSIASNSGMVYIGWTFEGYTGSNVNVFWQIYRGSGLSDWFLTVLSSTGGYIWSKKMGWAWPDDVASLAIDPIGSVYVAGSFTGTAISIFSGTYTSSWLEDAYVAKLTSTWNVSWVVKWWWTGYEDVTKIAYHPDGSLYVIGRYDSYDKPFVLVGTWFSGEWRTAGPNAYVTRLNATTGQAEWTLHIGGDNNDFPNDIAISSSWSVFVLGKFKDTICYLNNSTICPAILFGGWIDWNYWNTFLAELAWTGASITRMRNYEWWWSQLHIDTDWSVIILGQWTLAFEKYGYENLFASWSSDTVYAKLNSNLYPEWVKMQNSPGYEVPFASIINSENNIEVVWYSSGTLSLYGNTLFGYGWEDIFTLRFSTNTTCEPQECDMLWTYYGYIPTCSMGWCTPPGTGVGCVIYDNKCSMIADGMYAWIPDIDCDNGGWGWGGGLD
jgi:hypothetical protein